MAGRESFDVALADEQLSQLLSVGLHLDLNVLMKHQLVLMFSETS